jgi:hypothetical protein
MSAVLDQARNTVAQFPTPAGLPSVKSRITDLMMHGDTLDRMFQLAQAMAEGTAGVPLHLRGKPSDCLAVVMQSIQWGISPFAAARKSFLAPNGTIDYEAQLISAVIAENAPTVGLPRYEHFGDWTKVLGKFQIRKNSKEKDYHVATYTAEDEEGLGVRCIVQLRGESEPRIMEVTLQQCQPRFSTQWATDPKQQICYVAIRKWGRANTPGVLLGVGGDDDMASSPVHMGAADVVGSDPYTFGADPAAPEDPKEVAADASAAQGVAAYSEFWAALTKSERLKLGPRHEARKEVALQADRNRTVDAAAASVVSPAGAPAPDAAAQAGAPGVTAEGLRAQMKEAFDRKDKAALEAAADLIGMAPEGTRGPLGEEFEALYGMLQ